MKQAGNFPPVLFQFIALEYSLGIDATTPAGNMELQTPSLTSSNGSGTSGISSMSAPNRAKLTESTSSLTHLTLDCPRYV